MDLIADYYIHRSAEDYRNFGIYRANNAILPAETGNIYFTNYMNEKNRIIGELGDVAARREMIGNIEKDYRRMLFGDGKDVISFREKAKTALNEMLAEKYQDKNKQLCGQVSANNLLKVNLNDINPSEIEQTLSQKFTESLRRLDGQTKMSLTNLEHIVDELKLRLKELQLNNAGSLATIRNQLGDDSATFSKILGKLTRTMNTVKRNMGEARISGGKAMVMFGDEKKGGDLSQANLQYIQKLIDILDIPIAAASANQQGDIGEWIAPMVNLMTTAAAVDGAKDIKNITTEELKKIANAANLGEGGLRISVDMYGQTSVSSGKIKAAAESQYYGVSCQYHRNKVDAEFYYKDKNAIEKASVKNYGSFSGLTIVDNTPLYNMLLYSQDAARFSAHYLNTMVNHLGSDVYFESYKQQAQDALRINMLNLALKGYDKTSQPTTFIVFNSKAKDVKCFDTTLLLYDLVNNVYNSKITLSNMVHNTDDTVSKIETDFSNMSIEQNLNAPSAEARMQDLIDNLRNQKLHIAISINSKI